MLVNADLGQRAVSFADEAEWAPSPMAGVERRMLERDGDEVARATSVVRYRPGSRFPRHEHALGEEFLVLEGTFEDEQGQYPAGTYVRNPPGSGHAPWSDAGCVLFVKLRQFHPDDRERVVVDTRSAEWFPGIVKGIAVLPLHGFGSERVSLVRWAANTRFMPHVHPGGEEIFVLDGAVEDEEGRYAAGSWLRNPPGSQHMPFSLEGCLLYVKIGHLPEVVK
ncbi:Predicted transcription negative regulator [Candidatus Defluviicoccus seviourii]|uniref:Predicted transcription negative regulator n=2 Tax=root TaxID=1 RepID=A0A564WB97_9PROT|nr:Predicted transcription negative regulator [Candidatus Defluviicoccus seviourii]